MNAPRSSPIRIGCLSVALLGGLLLLWLGLLRPSPALAHSMHAILLRSDPADGSVLTVPPSSIHLWFSEQAQTVGQAITVIDPSGKQVEHGSVHANGVKLSVDVHAAASGTYLVAWQVISQDTDPASGRFVFSVRHTGGMWADTTESSSVSPLGLALQVAARWLHFVGYALGFGSLAFLVLVLRPLALERMETAEQRLWQLVTVGILALVLAEPLALLAQVVSLGTIAFIDPDVVGDVLASSFGRVLAQRLGAAVLLWVLIGLVKQGERRAISAALVLALVLAFIDGQASHSVTSGPLWLGLIATALHIAAMGTWVGGLATLLVVWRQKQLSGRHNEIVARFGQVAAIAVVELLATGAILAFLHIGRPTALFTTAYGRVLTAKLILLPAIPLLLFVTSRVQKVRQPRWWTLEAIVLTGILVLAGLLMSLPPAA